MSDTSSGWSTSDDDSSGNEYSVRTRQDKLEEIEQKKLYKKSKKKKKHKKEKKSKKAKYKCDKSDSDINRQKDNIKYGPLKKGIISEPRSPGLRRQSEGNSRNRSPSKDTKRLGLVAHNKVPNKRTSSPPRTKQKYIPASYRSKSPEGEHARDHSRLHGRSKSRSLSRSRNRSWSRNRSKSRNSRSRSRSRSRNRSGSRNGNRSRNRSRSRDHDHRSVPRKSTSRDQHSNRNIFNRSHRERSRSPYQRNRSRSQERRNRSRSHDGRRSLSRSPSYDRKRKSNRTPSPRKKSSLSDNVTKLPLRDDSTKTKTTSAWDVRTTLPITTTVNDILTKDTTPSNCGKFISITSSKIENTLNKDNINETFSCSNNSVNAKSIEIKIPTPISVEKTKEDPKSQVYGKWEAYQPQNSKAKTDLGKFMKMCREISAKEGIEESPVKSEEERDLVHHPFAVKEAPVYTPPYFPTKPHPPTNPAQAIMAGSLLSLMAPTAEASITGPLEKHFPVSSGTDHRNKCNATETDIGNDNATVFDEVLIPEVEINTSAVIARRLGAQQILTANPNDYSAQLVMAECDQKLKRWSDGNKKPGKFTGEVGVKMNKKMMFTVGSKQSLVQKDFFHNLRPVTGGIGMKMLQNMGWREGQPLGKTMQGFVVPISIDVKIGRAGLYAEEEMPKRVSHFTQQYQTPTCMGRSIQPIKQKPAPVENVGGKHPVSALAEHMTKRKMGIPEYSVVTEEGASYAKLFLMKVIVESVSYQPTEPSLNKKHAKAMAATVALKSLGVLE